MEDISVFIKKIEGEIEGLTPGALLPDSNFRELPEWSSMHALIIIALAETDYDVSITGQDLRECKTVRDLHNLISSRS
ncbi:MAG: acyl carrier protein [Bacteroidota bacterium]|nr:acyl carrier protein [Bacteroidota bacterium]